MGCNLHTVEVKDFADGWIKVMETVHEEAAQQEAAYWPKIGHASRLTTEYLDRLPEHPTICWFGPTPRYGKGEDGD